MQKIVDGGWCATDCIGVWRQVCLSHFCEKYALILPSIRARLQSALEDVEVARLHRREISKTLEKLQDKCSTIEGLLQTPRKAQKASFAALRAIDIHGIKMALTSNISGIHLNPRYDEVLDAASQTFE
jgi:hypothetical protein